MNALFYLHQTLVRHGKPTYNQHINNKKLSPNANIVKITKMLSHIMLAMEKQCYQPRDHVNTHQIMKNC